MSDNGPAGQRQVLRAQLARAEKVIEAAREWLRVGDRFGPAAHHKLATALAEYDRPSAPPDGRAELG